MKKEVKKQLFTDSLSILQGKGHKFELKTIKKPLQVSCVEILSVI